MLVQKCILTNGSNAPRGVTAGEGEHYFNIENGMVIIKKLQEFEYFHISTVPYGTGYKAVIKKDEPIIDLSSIYKDSPNLKVVEDRPKGKSK